MLYLCKCSLRKLLPYEYIYIYIYIYNNVYMYIYIYIYIDRERYAHTHFLFPVCCLPTCLGHRGGGNLSIGRKPPKEERECLQLRPFYALSHPPCSVPHSLHLGSIICVYIIIYIYIHICRYEYTYTYHVYIYIYIYIDIDIFHPVKLVTTPLNQEFVITPL